jgi:ribosome-binding protein aMBF1 (putative translation factor)
MKYLAIIGKVVGKNSYIGVFADNFAGFSAGKTRAVVETKLAYALAEYFQDQPQRSPVAQSLQDYDPEYLEGLEHVQTAWIEPAELNPVNAEIQRAMSEAGVTQSELARRLKLSRAAVSKIVNPSNEVYKTDTLERIADAIGAKLEVRFQMEKPAKRARKQAA